MPDVRPPPAFTGLQVFRETDHRFSLLVALDWPRTDLGEGDAVGAMYSPNPADSQTSFAVEARWLEVAVRPSDLAALRRGFYQGLGGLPDSKLSHRSARADGEVITLEARQTFTDEAGATRKRWVRLVFRGRTQVRLIAQGSSPAEFDHWLAMFAESMRSFRFGDWWADWTGVEWADSAVATDL